MKIALTGTGVIGRVHAKILASLGRDISAVCDIDMDKARAFAAELCPNAKVYSDFASMLEAEKLDVVHICTPHYLHVPQTVYALDRGINVLCEKPICAHREQLALLLEAEEKSTAVLGISQQNRFNETTRYALEILKECKAVSGHATVCWRRDEEYYKAAPWRGKLSEAGGGSLINQALHTLDLLALFCGTPTHVTARADIYQARQGVEVEDTVTAFFEGECEFSFFSTNNAFANHPVELALKLEDGREMHVLPKTVLIDGKTVFEAQGSAARFGKSYYGDAQGTLFAEYYDSLESGRHFPIDGKEAAKVMRMILAVYESCGKRVEIV